MSGSRGGECRTPTIPIKISIAAGASKPAASHPHITRSTRLKHAMPVCRFAISAILALLLSLTFAAPARANEAADIAQMFRAGEQTEAFARLDKLLANRTASPELRFLKGVLLVEVRRTSEALVVFQNLTEEFPELPEPYNNLAVLYAASGEFEKARTALEGAIRANPGLAVAYLNLGDVYAQLARQAYQKALKIDPASAGIPARLSVLRDLTESRSHKPAP
jgi:Flp pilus assembly protein TadD